MPVSWTKPKSPSRFPTTQDYSFWALWKPPLPLLFHHIWSLAMDAILSPWDVVWQEGPREHLPGLMLDHTSITSQNKSFRQGGICFSPSRGQRHEFHALPGSLASLLTAVTWDMDLKEGISPPEVKCSHQRSEGHHGPNVLTLCSAAYPLQGWLTDPEFQQLLVIHKSERAQGPCRGLWREPPAPKVPGLVTAPVSLSTLGTHIYHQNPSLACYKLQQKIKRHMRGREKYAYYLK